MQKQLKHDINKHKHDVNMTLIKSNKHKHDLKISCLYFNTMQVRRKHDIHYEILTHEDANTTQIHVFDVNSIVTI